MIVYVGWNPGVSLEVVFGISDGQRDVDFAEQQVGRLLLFVASRRLAVNDHAALGEIYFLVDLRHLVQVIANRAYYRRRNELRADMCFREGLLVHLWYGLLIGLWCVNRSSTAARSTVVLFAEVGLFLTPFVFVLNFLPYPLDDFHRAVVEVGTST